MGKNLAVSLALSLMVLAPPLLAQDDEGYEPFSPDQLDNLLAPIALYPDPLLAQVLVAATFPDQVDQAARFVRDDANADDVDGQPWDVSVKAVAHYSEVLEMMADKLDWTTALGQAYVNQSTDLMTSVQRLRAQARAAGNLTTTPEMEVVDSGGEIELWPAQPQYIFVPEYDPAVVFFGRAPLSFHTRFPIGAWLIYDCDWRGHRVFDHGWERGRGWVERSRPYVHVNNVYGNDGRRNAIINPSVSQRRRRRRRPSGPAEPRGGSEQDHGAEHQRRRREAQRLPRTRSAGAHGGPCAEYPGVHARSRGVRSACGEPARAGQPGAGAAFAAANACPACGREAPMNRETKTRGRAAAAIAPFVLACILFTGPASVAGATAPKQRLFATPQEAVQALIQAVKTADQEKLSAILGPEREKLLSGDPVEDADALKGFGERLGKGATLEKVDDAKYTLVVGEDRWPSPIPIVKEGRKWRFDTAAGLDEILSRRIGENELSTIMTCRAYVLAQWEYYTQARDTARDGLAVYAQHFISTPGKRDG